MYTWEYDKDSELWRHDVFDTVEECVEDAKSELLSDAIKTIAVGEVQKYEITIDATDVLDGIEEQAYYECGDASDGWNTYNYKTDREDLDELSDQLSQCVTEWLKKKNNLPHFYSVDNVKTVSLS